MGDYDKALDYLNRSLEICEELSIREGIRQNLDYIGVVYYEKGDYNKAVETLEKYEHIFRKEKGEDYERSLSFISYLYLSYKKLGKDYDEVEVRSLFNESKDKELNSYLNYVLYELLEDRLFLEKAYNQIQEKVDTMDTKLKEKFLNYPIPKQIIEEYNKQFLN